MINTFRPIPEVLTIHSYVFILTLDYSLYISRAKTVEGRVNIVAVKMTRSNEVQGSSAARLLEMILPRPSSTFLMRCPGETPSILVVDRSLPPSEGARVVLGTEKGLRVATLGPDFNPSRVWGVVTWIIRSPS